MTKQTILILSAASIGFAAAIFFCYGSVLMTAKNIVAQATPKWDFNESLAQALAAQHSQYLVGALLLIISFLLQVLAVQADATTTLNLPKILQSWESFVVSVLIVTFLISGIFSYIVYQNKISKIQRIQQEQIEESDKESK